MTPPTYKSTKYGNFVKTRQNPNKINMNPTKNVGKVTVVKLNLPPAYEDEEKNDD